MWHFCAWWLMKDFNQTRTVRQLLRHHHLLHLALASLLKAKLICTMLAKLKRDEAVGNFSHQISEDLNGTSLPNLTPKLWLYWCVFEWSSTMEAHWNSLDNVGLWKFDGFITDVQFLHSSGILDPGRNAGGNIPAKAWGTAEPKRAVVPALKLSLTKIDELQFQFRPPPPSFYTPTSLCSGFILTLWTWPWQIRLSQSSLHLTSHYTLATARPFHS